MEKEVMKYYQGKATLPFGIPTVIVTGWTVNEHLHCERIILFKRLSPPVIKRVLTTNISVSDFKKMCDLTGEEASLENFMETEGKEMAEHDIFTIIAELNDQLKPPAFNYQINNEIKEIKKAVFLNILLDYNLKNKQALDWVYDNTSSSLLKQQIIFIRQLNITKNGF